MTPIVVRHCCFPIGGSSELCLLRRLGPFIGYFITIEAYAIFSSILTLSIGNMLELGLVDLHQYVCIGYLG